MASHVDEEEKSGKALDDWIDEAVAAGKGWSDEERDRYLQGLRDSEYELPLFADSVDEMDPDIVSGLQELRDEEPPDILAEAAKAEAAVAQSAAVAEALASAQIEAEAAQSQRRRLCRSGRAHCNARAKREGTDVDARLLLRRKLLGNP